jgi:hypothetical protein
MEFWKLEIPVAMTRWVTCKALVGSEALELVSYYRRSHVLVGYCFNIETTTILEFCRALINAYACDKLQLKICLNSIEVTCQDTSWDWWTRLEHRQASSRRRIRKPGPVTGKESKCVSENCVRRTRNRVQTVMIGCCEDVVL